MMWRLLAIALCACGGDRVQAGCEPCPGGIETPPALDGWATCTVGVCYMTYRASAEERECKTMLAMWSYMLTHSTCGGP